MRNLLLASAFLATASLALHAPLSGPAYLDPVFPAVSDDDRDEELEALLEYVPSPRPNRG